MKKQLSGIGGLENPADAMCAVKSAAAPKGASPLAQFFPLERSRVWINKTRGKIYPVF